MKRILLAGTALLALTAAQPTLAADAPVYKGPAPIAAAALFNWSGCYIGVNAGGVWGRSNIDIPAYPSNFNIDMSSIAGGGQIGCNWQAPGSAFVVGIEGDGTWMNLDGSALSGGALAERYGTRWDWSASIRGRLGWAPGPTLWYVTGGAAWAHLSNGNFIPGAVVTVAQSGTHAGWVVGAGVEHAVTPNWILGLEYLYAAYERRRYVYLGPVDVNLTTSTIRARASFKW